LDGGQLTLPVFYIETVWSDVAIDSRVLSRNAPLASTVCESILV